MSEPSPHSDRTPSPRHIPVLLREVLKYLDLQPGLIVVDGTVGAGGHSRKILENIGPEGKLIGLDRDKMMLQLALSGLSAANCTLRQASYAELPGILDELAIPAVDRVLLDLGLSSDQLADENRGFGFETGGSLDLRFDTSRGEPAWELLERGDESQLAEIFERFGEEKFSRAVAREIVSRRNRQPVHTAEELVDAVQHAIPQKFQRQARKHPATRIFQALRIAVNEELTHLEKALHDVLPRCLAPGGRLVILSFHSLEDRLVKEAFRDQDLWRNLTPKPIEATPAEKRINPRSRTAKLRAAEKK